MKQCSFSDVSMAPDNSGLIYAVGSDKTIKQFKVKLIKNTTFFWMLLPFLLHFCIDIGAVSTRKKVKKDPSSKLNY